MDHLQAVNPFAKRSSHSSRSLLIYKVLTTLSYLLVLLTGILNRYSTPPDGSRHHPGRTIWKQNHAHPSPFSLSPIIVDIYWILLLFLQIGYISRLFKRSGEDGISTSAANVASHFIAHNLLTFAFIMLWTRSRFILAEIILLLNFFNLLALYARHPIRESPSNLWIQHVPVISGPLAWTFVALFWDGAVMVGAEGLAARILANIAIWAWLIWGFVFLAAFKDWSMGGEMAWLTLAVAIHQLTIKVVALQWIFALVVMGLLVVGTLGVGVPGAFGKEWSFQKRDKNGDEEGGETAPLLRDAQ